MEGREPEPDSEKQDIPHQHSFFLRENTKKYQKGINIQQLIVGWIIIIIKKFNNIIRRALSMQIPDSNGHRRGRKEDVHPSCCPANWGLIITGSDARARMYIVRSETVPGYKLTTPTMHLSVC